MTEGRPASPLARRALIRAALRASTYAAPAILASGIVSPVAAASPAPAPCTQPVTIAQDAVLYDAAPNATYNVYLQPNGTGPFSLLGTIATNPVGFGFTPFPVTFDSSLVSFLRLTVTVPGADPATAPAAPPFDAPLIGLTACPRTGLVRMRAFSVPTTTACALGGAPTSWQLYVDAAVLNASANTAYDLYAQLNGTGAFQFVVRGTTNAQGNLTVVSPLAFTGVAPTSVVVNVVPAGGGASPATYTASASGGTLITVRCPPPGITSANASGARLAGL